MKGYTHYTPAQQAELLTLVDLARGKVRTAAITALAKKWSRKPLKISQALSRLKKLKGQGLLPDLLNDVGLFKQAAPKTVITEEIAGNGMVVEITAHSGTTLFLRSAKVEFVNGGVKVFF